MISRQNMSEWNWKIQGKAYSQTAYYNRVVITISDSDTHGKINGDEGAYMK